MHVRQLENEADAIFSLRRRELLSRFSQETNEALEDQREILVAEVTSEVWRREEQVCDWRTELSRQALHSEDVTQTQKSRICWTTSAPDRTGSGNTGISRDVWRISSWSISRWTRNWSTCVREVRHQKNDRAIFHAPWWRNRTDLSPTNPGQKKASNYFANYAAKSCNWKHWRYRRVSPTIFKTRIESQKEEIQSLQRDRSTVNTWFTVQFGRSEPRFDSRCLCWSICCYIDMDRPQNYRNSCQSPTTSRRRPRALSQGEDTMPKAASKLAAAPSTPPASTSKTPMAGPDSSNPTISWPVEGAEATVTVSDLGGHQKREADGIIFAKGLFNQQILEVGKLVVKFVSKVRSFILRNILRAAMLWIGEVEDAKSVDDFITSACTTGEPFQDF